MGFTRLQRRVTQPQGPAQIDRGNPLTAGLAFLTSGATPFHDAATNIFAAPNGVSRRQGSIYQEYMAASNASVAALFSASKVSTSDGAGTGDFTAFALASPVASATPEMMFSMSDGVGELYFTANTTGALIAESGTFNVHMNLPIGNNVNTTGVVNGARHLFLFTRSGTVGTVYVDGVQKASGAVFAGAVWSAVTTNNVGGYASANWGVSGGVALVGAFNRALSSDEVRVLADNPWQLFQGPRTYMMTPTAASSPQRTYLMGLGA